MADEGWMFHNWTSALFLLRAMCFDNCLVLLLLLTPPHVSEAAAVPFCFLVLMQQCVSQDELILVWSLHPPSVPGVLCKDQLLLPECYAHCMCSRAFHYSRLWCK